jgi:hypothetical protein
MYSREIHTFAVILVMLFVPSTFGCGHDPEEELLGCWTETGWAYERADENASTGAFWNDGIRPRQYPVRNVVRHESELWRFEPRGRLHIGAVDGATGEARWRLKGRGHVLTIRHPDERFEVYDIKQITRDSLTLHFDMGMEVRGIARLDFQRTSCDAPRPRAVLAGSRSPVDPIEADPS